MSATDPLKLDGSLPLLAWRVLPVPIAVDLKDCFPSIIALEGLGPKKQDDSQHAK